MTPVASSVSFAFRKTVIQTMGPRTYLRPRGLCGRHRGSWGRGSFSRSFYCHWTGTIKGKYLAQTAERSGSGRNLNMEKLWQNLFSDPSQWWDHRSEKTNPKYPDFKHKKTQESLWLDNSSTPRWVEAELAAMAPGTVQSNIFSWNIRLRRCVKAGDFKKTLNLFEQMQREGIIPDKFTFVPVLNACSGLLALEKGRRIHLHVSKSGFECDVFVGSCLVDMYAKCGSIEDARKIFNKMPTRDAVCWGALILGYVKCGQGQEALELYRLMQRKGVDLSPVCFVGVLNACASIADLGEGRRAHEQIIYKGYESDLYVANSLVDMYAKCGSIEDARSVFNKMPTRDVISWGALILGYAKCGQGQEALDLFQVMQRERVNLDPITFVGVLNACASIGALDEGRRAHEQIIEKGYQCDVYVANSLVDMYAKCGCIEDARRVFDKMLARDVVSCNALILGYVKCGQGQEALELSHQMQGEGLHMNWVTFIGVLSACSSMGALEEGRRIHEHIIERGYGSDIYVASSLVDMYAKCGSIEDAQRVFHHMSIKNVVSWSTMLAAYCKYGYAKEALEHFEQMSQEVEVDDVSFVSLLSTCSHGGLVDEGMSYFESMRAVFNVSPTLEHYACVIDLLGRAGHLHAAEDLIRGMACEPDAPVWMSLLGACRTHGNLIMGELVAKNVLVLDPGNTAGYIMLSNVYAAAGKWDRMRAVHCERLEKM